MSMDLKEAIAEEQPVIYNQLANELGHEPGSQWPGIDPFEWDLDPYVVLPPAPEEAQRVLAKRAGWNTAELDARAIQALILADAEKLARSIPPEPEPEPEPEVVEVPPEVDEFLDDPETGVDREKKEQDNVDRD